MNELIRRSDLRDALYDADAITFRGLAILNTFPTVDAVEVIRCKDCEHRFYNEDMGMFACDCWGGGFDGVRDDDFCSRGERKDDETD